MMYLWITDYVQNTAWLVFQQAGVLNQTITPSMVRLAKLHNYDNGLYEIFSLNNLLTLPCSAL